MRNRIVKNFLMAVVLVIGLFASVFMSTDAIPTVAAETTTANLPVVEVKTDVAFVGESTIRLFANYDDVGNQLTSDTMTDYVYYLNNTEISITNWGANTSHNQVHTYNVKVKTGKKSGWFSWSWSELTDVEGASGSFQVALYSEVNVNVDTTDIDNGVVPTVTTNLGAIDADTYKAYYGDNATISFDRVEDYDVFVNDVKVDGNTYAIENIIADTTVNIRYAKSTNNTLVVDTNTLSNVTLKVNGERITSRNNIKDDIKQGSEITIDVVPNANYVINAVNCNGVALVDNLEDANFSHTFTAGASQTYNITVDAEFVGNHVIVDTSTTNNVSLEVNGTNIFWGNNLVVSAGETVTITATPNSKYLISAITCNGVALDNTANYPNFSATFVAGTKETYNIAVESYDASSTVTINGTGAKLYNDKTEISSGSKLNRDSAYTLTLKADNGNYIVDYSVNNAKVTAVRKDGVVEFTFTTGINENFVIDFSTEAMFVAQDSDIEINMYDILLMQEGNEFYKGIVYNTLFDNVYSNNTTLTVNDVKFEYYAGTYTIPVINKSFDMYVPVEKVSATTPDEVRAYVAERYSATIGNNLPDFLANDIANDLHRFGTLTVEKIQLVYAGDTLLPYTTISATVKAVDLREVVELDVNDHITVTYGSYNDDQFIINEILKGKNGVMAGDTAVTVLNAQLALKSGIVGKSVGETEVTIYLHGNDYFYKGTEKVVKVTIIKATVAVEMVKEVVNYELVQNGTINKDYIFDIVPEPEVVLENEEVDNVYFVMGLDIVDGEFIARVDLSNIMSADSDALGGLVDLDAALDKAIAAAIKYADPEGDGLTLVEFVNFITNLPNQAGQEGVELDTSYMEKITEVLTKISETIDVRIFVVNDGTDITPQQHGAYIVGVVTTDKNYNMASDFGYLVITAEILDVKFVANDVENSLRKFEFDGTQKVMTAEAYEVDSQVASGNMKYYYVGVQTDATFYASNDAPVNAGTYTVLALFNNAEEGGLPSKVGLGIGAMVIMPSDDAEVVVNNAVHTYNGETFDIASMVSVNKEDASLSYVTAGVYVDGDFSRDGYKALEGTVNIDFPARFDALLQEYMPEQFANGVNVNTFINLLNETKVGLENYGYTVDFVDNIIEVLGQMSNLVTITFNNLEDINPSDIGVFVVGAIVFDPNYLPKANLGVLVIQPAVTVSKMAWNYEDINGIITVPALSKMDMTASVVSGIDAVVEYIYFGIGNNGELIKVTDVADITSGIWMQVAYVNEEVSADMNLVLPIARIFVVIPQTVIVEINDDNNCLLRQYNGFEHTVTATATYFNGNAVNPEMLTITYIGVDTMGNRYYSNVAPTNAGIYTVIASYIERNDTTISHAGFAFAELVITLADTEIESNDTVVCYDGEEHNIEFVAEDGFDYVLVIENNGRVNVVLPATWTIDVDADILAELAKYLPEDKIQEIMANYNIGDIVVNEAMPTEIGEYAVTVIAINPNYNVAIAKNLLTIKDHNLVHHDAKAPTCTEFGWNEYFTCEDCDYTTYAVIDELGHSVVVDAAVSATCTATGLTEGTHCSVCNEVLLAQEVTDIIAHNESDWNITKAATCIAKGSANKVCTECNAVVDIKELDLVGHTTVHHEGKPATCTEAGYTEYDTCSVTGCTYNTKVVIDALGHNEVVDEAVPATCTTTGLTEGSHCSVCNEVLVEQEETDMIAHVTESHNGQPATCTTAGWTAYVTCENCTYTTKEIIPALGHTEVIDVAVPATCTETGLTEGRHCSVCDEVLHAQQVVAMVDHTYGHWFVGAYATATTDGYYARTCSVCNHEDRQAIDAYGDREVANIEITTGTNGKVTVDADSISEAVKDIEETGKKEIVISTGNAQETLTNVEIAVSSLQQIIGADSALTIETTDIHATFDKDALSSIFASVGNEDNVDFDLRFIELENLNETQRGSVSNKKVAGVLSLQVLSGDTVISSFGNGSVLVAIPFELAEGRTAEDYKIMYVAEDGTIEEINTAYLGGNLVVELGHFSEYVIVDLTKDEVKMTTAMIVAISVIAALALCACVGTIVLVRKEKKR